MKINHFCLAFGLFAAAWSARADDPLDSWTNRSVAGITANLQAVARGGGQFVAVGAAGTI
jgi:hypothetical protein